MKTDFQELRTTKTGSIGERIVRDILNEKGLIVFRPDVGPHNVDFLCSSNGKHMFAVEVKTYPRLHSKPYTGIDKRDWLIYNIMLANHAIDTVLIFIDWFEGMVYTSRLSGLQDVAKVQAKKVLFPLGAMRLERRLTPAEIAEIKASSKASKYKYHRTKRFFVPGWQKVT